MHVKECLFKVAVAPPMIVATLPLMVLFALGPIAAGAVGIHFYHGYPETCGAFKTMPTCLSFSNHRIDLDGRQRNIKGVNEKIVMSFDRNENVLFAHRNQVMIAVSLATYVRLAAE